MKIVVFLGPDGAGKSTIINAFIKQLNSWHTFEVIHFKPFIFKKRNSKPSKFPYEKKPYNSLLSFLRFVMWLIEYYLWIFKSEFEKDYRNKFIIFDRFLYDVNIDPIRYRINQFIAKIPYYYLLFPRPDFIFILNVDLALLQSRKKEVTICESLKQIESYQNYIQNKKNIYLINASQNVKEIVTQINSIIKDNK